jgi:hypothetical protein
MVQSPVTQLNADVLIAEAERQTGLSDWGEDRTFLTGLNKLIEAVEAMGCASKLRGAVAQEAVALLAVRLHFREDEKQHPEILRERIEQPLIIIGMPRTGTTWLHDLLSLDPASRAPRSWEVAMPWPAPEIATFDTDPRIAQSDQAWDAMTAVAPEFATMHRVSATAAEECNTILKYHFSSNNFWGVYGVPLFLDWTLSERMNGMFAAHRRFLQQLQWKGPRGRWLLKSPPHLLELDALIEAYPDACLVQTHREPTTIVASTASLLRTVRRATVGDIPEITDKKMLARSVLKVYGTALERATRSREKRHIDDRVIDIAYRETLSDPIGVVRKIYERFGLPFTTEYEGRLKAHIAAPRTEGHGAHHYSLAEYGVDTLDLPTQFPAYYARFRDFLGES